MTVFQAVVLGIIQGLTEFLPVSSSGHLIFLPKLFGWQDQGLAFDAVVHLGTLVAVVVYFREKLWNIVKSFFLLHSRNPTPALPYSPRSSSGEAGEGRGNADNRRLGILLVLSIIPAGLVGYFGEAWIETHFRSSSIIAFGLIGWGLVLFAADQYYQRRVRAGKAVSDINHLSVKQILTVALAQAIALIPGTSRSGITMTAGLFSNIDKKSAAEFSFLMSVPIIALAGAKKLFDLVTEGTGGISVSVLGVGFVTSALAGFIAIWGLMKIIQRWSFAPFVVYRIIVGVLILLLL